MMTEQGSRLKVSICDPDLRLYEGRDESQYLNNKQQEVSIYSRDWGKNESLQSELRVRLKGKYKLVEKLSGISASVEGEETLIKLMTQHADVYELTLEKL